MLRSLLLAVVSATLMFSFAPVHAQSYTNLKGNKKAGRYFVYTCAGCHGVPGYENVYPTYHVPLIAGQNRQYIIKALHEYKEGIRHHPTMEAQAEGMTNQDIANIAAYLSSLKPKVLTGGHAYNGPGVQKAITCEACHGKHGIAVTPQYADLAGQHADYIVQVLHEYKDGQRKNAIMNAMASQLSEQDMQQIAAYFASQKSPLSSLEHHIHGGNAILRP